MRNKIIIWSAIVLAVSTMTVAFAASNSWTTSTWNTVKEFKMKQEWFWKMWFEWKWFKNNLTTEEQKALETMTDAQKKEFFDKKRAEAKVQMEARENVMNKILSWETLTSDEQKIKDEIVKQRAEIKTKKQDMEEIRTIMQKQRNGETLTTEEQTKLDTFKASMLNKQKWKWGHKKEGNKWWCAMNK